MRTPNRSCRREDQTPPPLPLAAGVVVAVFVALVGAIRLVGRVDAIVAAVLCAFLTLTVLAVRTPPRDPMRAAMRLLAAVGRLLPRASEHDSP